MPICCWSQRTQKRRLCCLLFSLAIVVALHVFAFVVKFKFLEILIAIFVQQNGRCGSQRYGNTSRVADCASHFTPPCPPAITFVCDTFLREHVKSINLFIFYQYMCILCPALQQEKSRRIANSLGMTPIMRRFPVSCNNGLLSIEPVR